jgi:alkanesulfonate monooxygenase SsuD/methylene tetrahydromethanopterin reductase-like flavin-dependent oxidoreductase (luciferase family)
LRGRSGLDVQSSIRLLLSLIESPWPYTEYHGNDLKKLPFSIYTDIPWLDPFDTLAFLAAATEKPRLGLSVLIVPYRNPYFAAFTLRVRTAF